MSNNLSNINNNKINVLLVENQMETYYEYDDENPPRHSDSRQPKYLQQTLNSIH